MKLNNIHKLLLTKESSNERGQAIVIIAGALVGLLAIIGLITDGGMLYVQSSNLKRSVDAAAVSAALQYREGYSDAELRESALQFIQLNDTTVTDVIVEVCDTDTSNGISSLHNQELCPPVTNPPTPPKKTVRVTASKFVDFAFLPVIGMNGTTIKTSSMSEAASVDVVLVIDASESMAYETSGDPIRLDPGDDPAACNLADNCQPFRAIKDIAIEFVDTLYFPYDRVAIITFDRVAHAQPDLGGGVAPWIEDTNGNGTARDEVEDIIDNLEVYQPAPCVSNNPPNPSAGTCLGYNADGSFAYIGCPRWEASGRADPTSCTSSNIGGGLALAGNSFAQAPIREDALWAVILLAGGPANATNAFSGYPYGTCPYGDTPFCRDDDASARHTSGDSLYDGDDFARDMADFVTDPDNGQGAIIYAIGLGEKIRNDDIRGSSGDADIAEQLLTYAATRAGGVTDGGVYYYAPNLAELRAIFREIANNLATRITQ